MFQNSPVLISIGLVLSVCVYDAQLVLYHHSGQFIHPDVTTGTEGQFGLAVTHVAFGLWEYLLTRGGWNMYYHSLGAMVWGIGVVVVSCRVIWFYNVRLHPHKCLTPFFCFICYMAAAMWLFYKSYVSSFVFALLITLTSFRICATYVITTCVRESFKGYDSGCAAMLFVAILDTTQVISINSVPLSHYPWVKKDMLLLGAYFAWVVTRNIHLLSKHFEKLERK